MRHFFKKRSYWELLVIQSEFWTIIIFYVIKTIVNEIIISAMYIFIYIHVAVRPAVWKGRPL